MPLSHSVTHSRREGGGGFRKQVKRTFGHSLKILNKMISTESNSNVKLLIALTALVSSAQAQAITCTTSSPQCCWVWRVRELMKLSTTGASATSTTSCCSLSGITCSGALVTRFNVASKGITGSIPKEIGNLKNLKRL